MFYQVKDTYMNMDIRTKLGLKQDKAVVSVCANQE